MPNKRLYYLDMAKGVGIFLVILGHIEYLDPDIKRWISSFHMPLFFVVGGILAYIKEASSTLFREQWIRRANSLGRENLRLENVYTFTETKRKIYRL